MPQLTKARDRNIRIEISSLRISQPKKTPKIGPKKLNEEIDVAGYTDKVQNHIKNPAATITIA